MKYSHAIIVACIGAPHLISAAPHFLSGRDVDDSEIRARAPMNGDGGRSLQDWQKAATLSGSDARSWRSGIDRTNDNSAQSYGTYPARVDGTQSNFDATGSRTGEIQDNLPQSYSAPSGAGGPSLDPASYAASVYKVAEEKKPTSDPTHLINPLTGKPTLNILPIGPGNRGRTVNRGKVSESDISNAESLWPKGGYRQGKGSSTPSWASDSQFSDI